MFTTWDSIEVSGVMFQWGRTIGDVWIKSWLFKWRLNDSTIKGLWNCHHHHHLSLNHEGRWDTTDDFTTSFLHFSLFSTALWDLVKSRPVHSLKVVFLPLSLSALSSSPFHCALQDDFGQTWWEGDMSIPLKSASLYDGQEVFAWSNCLLDLGMDFLVGNMVFVWDA